MLLTRFSNTSLIRAAAVMSVLLGILYMPSLINFSLPIIGLGHELAGAQKLTEVWATYALFGGIGIFIGSFFLHLSRSIFFNRIILSIALVSALLLVTAQLPPLFWWLFVGGADFTWSSAFGFFLHFFLLILSLWAAIVTIYAFERWRMVSVL